MRFSFSLCQKIYGENCVQLKTSLTYIFLKVKIFQENLSIGTLSFISRYQKSIHEGPLKIID